MHTSDVPRNNPEIEGLIRESDELRHITRQLTRKTLTTERVRELIRTSDEIARNCEQILGLLKSQN